MFYARTHAGCAWILFLAVSAVSVSADTLPELPDAEPNTIEVTTVAQLEAAAEAAQPGDTIVLAKGRYNLTSQIAIKSGVTYQGAGKGLTVLDGNNRTRAFVAWGDRTHNDDQALPNDSGPEDWVLDGLTIETCVADGNDFFSYAGTAYALKDDFAENDHDGSGGLDIEEADAAVAAMRPSGPDGTEPSADDDLHRFATMDTDGDGQLSETELEAQLLNDAVEFANESRDGGAVFLDNGAAGTIRNCEFLNNYTPVDAGDGGAIAVAGLSVLHLKDCQFDGNYAVASDGSEQDGPDGDGGHIKVQTDAASALTPGTTLFAEGCFFLNGRAEDDGGAIHADAVGSIIRLDACWFEGSTAADDGTVLYMENGLAGELTVTNCIFAYNRASYESRNMCHVTRHTKFVNCSFVGNSQGDFALIHNAAEIADTDQDDVNDEFRDVTEVVNCLFADNIVGNGDHVLRSDSADFTLAATNCLFSNNKRWNTDDAPNVRKPYVIETGSVEADPRLDATLLPGPGSPAIDAGVDPAAFGVELLTDFSGNPRPQGAGYDIGADEQ
jgi:hypothetical protein